MAFGSLGMAVPSLFSHYQMKSLIAPAVVPRQQPTTIWTAILDVGCRLGATAGAISDFILIRWVN